MDPENFPGYIYTSDGTVVPEGPTKEAQSVYGIDKCFEDNVT